MSEWHWPQIVFCIGLSCRTIALLREVADKPDTSSHVIAILLITGATAYILHAGGFW